MLGTAQAVTVNTLKSLCSLKNEIGLGPTLYLFIIELRL